MCPENANAPNALADKDLLHLQAAKLEPRNAGTMQHLHLRGRVCLKGTCTLTFAFLVVYT